MCIKRVLFKYHELCMECCTLRVKKNISLTILDISQVSQSNILKKKDLFNTPEL